MANAIGSAALVLTTNATRLYAGLAEVASRSKRIVKSIGKSINSGVSGVASGIGKLAGGMASVAKGGAMAGIGVAAAAAAVGVGVLYKGIESISALVKQGDMAKSLGVTPEFFTGLAGAAQSFDVELGAVFEGLVNMGGQASQALKGGDLGNTFKRLGIDVQAFSSMGVEQQFTTLTAALNTITDPAERVRIAMQVLGEEAGKKMVPLISKSEAELKKLTGQFAVSAEEMKKMKVADDAMKTLSASVGGLWKQVLVGMTPIIEFFGTKLTTAIETAQPTLDAFGRVFTTVWTVAVDVIGAAYSAISEVVSAVGEWLGAIAEVSGSSLSLESVVVGAMQLIATTGAYAWDTLKVGVGSVAVAVGLLIEGIGHMIDGFSSLVGLLKKLPDNLRPPGLDGFIQGVDDLATSTKKSGEELRHWGEGTFKNFGKSAEDVDKWFGKKSGDWMQKVTAKPKPKGDGEFVGPPAPKPEKPAEALKYTAVGAAVKGSAAALSIEAKYRTEQMTDPKIAIVQKQLAEQQKQTQAIKEVTEAIRSNPVQFNIF